jgi:hypothetical protein
MSLRSVTYGLRPTSPEVESRPEKVIPQASGLGFALRIHDSEVTGRFINPLLRIHILLGLRALNLKVENIKRLGPRLGHGQSPTQQRLGALSSFMI